MGNSCSSSLVLSPHDSDFSFGYSDGLTAEERQKLSWKNSRFSPRPGRRDNFAINETGKDSSGEYKEKFWIRPNVNERKYHTLEQVQENFDEEYDVIDRRTSFDEDVIMQEDKENYVRGRPVVNENDDTMSIRSAGTLKLETPRSKCSSLSSSNFDAAFIAHVRQSSSREFIIKSNASERIDPVTGDKISPDDVAHCRYESMGPIHFETPSSSRDFGKELSEYSFDSVSSLIEKIQREVAKESNLREELLFRDRSRANFDLITSGYTQNDSRRTTSVTSSSTGMTSEGDYGGRDLRSRTLSSMTGVSCSSTMGVSYTTDETSSSIIDGPYYISHDINQSMNSISITSNTSQEFSSQELDLSEIDDFLKVFTNRNNGKLNNENSTTGNGTNTKLQSKNMNVGSHVRQDSPCVFQKPSPLLKGTLQKAANKVANKNKNNGGSHVRRDSPCVFQKSSPLLSEALNNAANKIGGHSNKNDSLSSDDLPCMDLRPSTLLSAPTNQNVRRKSYSPGNRNQYQRRRQDSPCIQQNSTRTLKLSTNSMKRKSYTAGYSHTRKDTPTVEPNTATLLKEQFNNTASLIDSPSSSPIRPKRSSFTHNRQDTPNIRSSTLSRYAPESPEQNVKGRSLSVVPETPSFMRDSSISMAPETPDDRLYSPSSQDSSLSTVAETPSFLKDTYFFMAPETPESTHSRQSTPNYGPTSYSRLVVPDTPVNQNQNRTSFSHSRQDTPNIKPSSLSKLVTSPDRYLECPSCDRQSEKNYDSESEDDYSRQVVQNTPKVLSRSVAQSSSCRGQKSETASRSQSSHTPGLLYPTPEFESVTPQGVPDEELRNVSKSQRSSTRSVAESETLDRTSKSCRTPLLESHSVLPTSDAPYSEGYRKHTYSGKDASDTEGSNNTNLFERFCYDDSIGEEENVNTPDLSYDVDNDPSFNVIYVGVCSFQNRKRTIEIRKYVKNGDLQLVLHATELTMVVNLQHMLQTVVDECWVLICFSENELNLEFANAAESTKFTEFLPKEKLMHVVFSSEAILLPDMVKADLRLVKQGSGKRLCDAQNIPTLVLTLVEEKKTVSIAIERETSCSVQQRFVALNEYVEPKIVQFPHFSVANHFAHVFSVLKHDLYQVDFVVIFSGLVKHLGVSKKIEIRQYDSGTTKLLIFKNKETYFIFPYLPTFEIRGAKELYLELESEENTNPMNLEFCSTEEMKYFTHFMNPVVE